ncbi:hypothetical protein PU629_03025 [Pullulanibacillus sp. KACC 23026]|uniref:hypothetical protein n=1 Tax=Pullulanibacillus sp. KACC 23026 TaxID=3028315 RepID=UPI0023B093A2|nr:hypothetical protein [Pullulanibacillus sp. KACC 23026]WEG13354.1 hypothetical protein PU629_03025 [Pullulanibacillus sp. KACC 23026]
MFENPRHRFLGKDRSAQNFSNLICWSSLIRYSDRCQNYGIHFTIQRPMSMIRSMLKIWGVNYEPGEPVTIIELDAYLEKLDRLIDESEIVGLSGNTPKFAYKINNLTVKNKGDWLYGNVKKVIFA